MGNLDNKSKNKSKNSNKSQENSTSIQTETETRRKSETRRESKSTNSNNTQPSRNKSQETDSQTETETRRESGGFLRYQIRKNSKNKSTSRSAPEKLSVKTQPKKDEKEVSDRKSSTTSSKNDISTTRTKKSSQQFEIPATNSPSTSKTSLKSIEDKSHPDQDSKNENDEENKVVGVICDRESKSCENLVQDRHSTVQLRHEEPLITRHMLYKEALYTSVHSIGKPSNRFPVPRDELCVYSHITFASDPKEQIAVMEHIVTEPFPLTVVNAVIRKAEYLEGRNAKHEGRCSPYCLITIETVESLDKREYQYINGCSPAQRQRDIKKRARPLAEKRSDQLYDDVPIFIKTEIQKLTNFPEWNQRFQCLALRPTVDILTIEVWDHLEKYKDEVQTALESSKSSTKDKKETDNNKRAYPEKKDDFLGKAVIQISEIPVEGEEKWHFLKGHSKKIEKDSGKVLIQAWLTHSFRHGKHHHEYVKPNIMLAHLWDHILQVESARFKGEWNGEIPPAANCLLFQYGLQNGLSEDAQAVIRWNSYAKYNLGSKGTQRRLAELGSTLTRLDTPYRKNSTGQTHIMHDSKNGLKNDQQIGDASIGESIPLSEDVKPSEMELSMVILVQEKVIPVLSNHLSESQEKVDDAVKSVKYAKGVLTKLEATSANKKVDSMVLKSIREAVRNWYQVNFDRIVLLTDDVEDYEVIASMAMLMKVVNELLKEGNGKWSPHFWLEVEIDYMPIVYDELQKCVSRDVEKFCTRFLEPFPYHQKDVESFKITNKRLRRLLTSKNHGFEFNLAFKNLYVQTRKFVLFQEVIFQSSNKPHYANLMHYDRWFRPILILWLGFAFIKATDIIYRAIEIDDNVIEDKLVKHSSSAVDTASVYYRLESFWKELKWPDLSEGYVVLKFLLETMCYISILYARMKRMKLENEGYFDTEDRFDISPRLCTALNNIEFVKEALLKIPQEIELGKLMNNLEKEVGPQMGSEKKKEIEDIFNFMLCKVDKQFGKVWQEVGNRLRFDIKERLENMMVLIKEGKNEQEALEPLLSYLEPNIVTFKTHLMDVNFAGSLEMIWMVVCQEMFYKIINKLPATKQNQTHYLNKIERIFPILIFYFEGGGGGLTKEQLDTQEYQKIITSIKRIRSGQDIENIK